LSGWGRCGEPARGTDRGNFGAISKSAFELTQGVCPMKSIHLLLGVLLAASTLQAQTLSQTNPPTLPEPTPYTVVAQGANHQVWQSETYEQAPNGRVVTNILQYTELATGLNHLVNGQWVASSEEIDIAPDGSSAWATNGQHQVYFPGDIYNGEIKLVTPDGKTLLSQPIALMYSDGSNSVLLAVVTNATGQILASGNQVTYTNAFDGLDADLLYTYTKAGFEQDVILQQQPPDPASLGLNPQTTRIQVLTEFFSPPQPVVTATTMPTAAGDLENDSLSFGVMQMGQGKAFLIGASSLSVGVDKQWLELEGRQFLVEEVPIVSIANEIDALPPYVAQAGSGTKPVVSKNLILPPQRLTHTSPKGTFLAKATPPNRGFVLDYVTLNSDTNNFTFQGDTTYYISGTVNLSGTNTFEGGAVLKYTNGASISLGSGTGLNWLGSAYRPVILTARDDNSVGESISGSTGNPTNYYANPALNFNTTPTFIISHFRIAWAAEAIGDYDSQLNFYDGQLVNCQVGISSIYSDINLRNLLFGNVQTNFTGPVYGNIDIQNSTFAGSSYLTPNLAYGGMSLENCILANVTNLTNTVAYATFTGTNNGFYLTPPFGTATNGSTTYPFQSVGAGNYYLTNGCNFLNAGTTNIDPVLLSSLAQLTTYPPTNVYSNTTVSSTTWTPQVQRDTNAAPTLGYHYAPIDYVVGNVTVSGTLTLSQGVAVASFDVSNTPSLTQGFGVGSGDQLTSVGTAVVHNQLCNYAAVQEQPILWGGLASKYAILMNVEGVNLVGSYPAAVLYGRFTDFNGLAGLGTSAAFAGVSPNGVQIGGGDPMEFNLRDCRVGPGWLTCDTYQGTDTNICINNLFDRGGIIISDFDGDSPVAMQNSLVHNGYVTFDNENLTYTWTIQNNFFDSSTVGGDGLSEDHNGYWNTTQLTPTNANDVVVTNFIYATGPLGNYYQVSTNLLFKGSTTAAVQGLYHYTVQTNLVGGVEVAEGTNTVSIGFHYVAVDQYGNPLDSNGDGIPDYLEDANGNGSFDTGDLGDWQNLNLNVIITRPRNGSILP
jgi:hypothetical protein